MTDYKAKQILEENVAVYNTIAKDFSKTRTFLWHDLKDLRRYVEKGNTVVDIGCGNGRLSQLFWNLDVNYIGIDQSKNLIDIARERFPDGRFFVNNMIKTTLQDSIADTVFCIAAFQHLPSREFRVDALMEMRRILKPGGTIVMMNWNLYSDWARQKYTCNGGGDFSIPWKNKDGQVLGMRFYHGFLFEELHELANEVGLQIITQFYTKKGEVSSIGTGENILTVMKAAEEV